MGTNSARGAAPIARAPKASHLVARLGALRRASPLGFPFAVIAALSIIGTLSPPLLIALAVVATVLGLRFGLRRLATKPGSAPPPLNTNEIQNLLRTQFRAQPQMRDAARKSEALRAAAPVPAPVPGAGRARPPHFASVAAGLLLGIGVPMLLGQGLGLGAALMASACVFFLLAIAATRPVEHPAHAALDTLLDRVLAPEQTGAMGESDLGDGDPRDERDAVRRFHLQLPEDDGTDLGPPPAQMSFGNPFKSQQRRQPQ